MPGRSVPRSGPTSRPPSRRRSAAELTARAPDASLIARFRADLDRLAGPAPLGLAVSGGADSVALLLLAAAARPGMVTAISIDHGLRAEAAGEVDAVERLCERLAVPHRRARLDLEDGAAVQARAREARYAAMGAIAAADGLAAVATAHHADDQAETLLMRLERGSGISGLAGIRPIQRIGGLTLVRPLLGWRKAELEAVCRDAGIDWAEDPSNRDPRFARAAMRRAMAGLDLDVDALARSAAALGEAEAALEWAVEQVASRLVPGTESLRLDPSGLPAEIRRRLLLRAFAAMDAPIPRGGDLGRAIAALEESGAATLSGLLLASGPDGWTIRREPPRRS